MSRHGLNTPILSILTHPHSIHFFMTSPPAAAAIDMARLHLERCQATFGKYSLEGIGSLGLLSDALLQVGQSDEAVSMLTNAATACEGECGYFNVSTARMFYKLGEVHSQRFNNPGLAKKYSSRAMLIYSSIYGDHHPLTKVGFC